MVITLIVGWSLLLQLITIVFSLQLIPVTGGKKAWLLLSIGIIAMGVRRLETFIGLLSGDLNHSLEMSYEIIGFIGSSIMLWGVILIKPIFLSLSAAEKQQRELVLELQSALSKVKLLSGFLPICSSCKRIRDDKGYWEQIESYVREHSEVEFSHSICPECVKKLYPEYAKRILEEKKG
jgi:hypothetical protein